MMAGPNKIPDHMQRMGTLVVNLQSLEFALRAFLHNREKRGKYQSKPNFMDGIKEGQELEVNAFTSYDTLAKLIEKYNKSVSPDIEVDPRIARVRDALAHGRIAGLSPSPNEPMRLVKYSKPANGRVLVTDYHVLTKEWFDERIKWVYESIKKVSAANDCHHSSQ